MATKKQRAAELAEKKAAAESTLREAGCTYETRQDKYGFTDTGWFQDGVYLDKSPYVALMVLRGCA